MAFVVVALGLCIASVAKPKPPQPGGPVTREYWVKAENVEWNFMPSWPLDLMMGEDMTGDIFTDPDYAPGFKGRIYTKAVFRQYSKNFAQLVDGAFAPSRGPGQPNEHMGIIGPAIRAVVGDTIIVHFKNESSIPASIHPHGVEYGKTAEGSPYLDGHGGPDADDPDDPVGPGDMVMPGDSHDYVWDVPARAGPGPLDPSSIVWLYHAHTPETESTNAGLIGPIVITAPGLGRADATPRDVDKEFFTLYTIFNENVSALFDENFPDGMPEDADPDEFEESNLMHGMNGLLWGNNTGYTMNRGDKARWYIMAMGTEVDNHTAHWHGTTLLHGGQRMDVIDILPAQTKTLDMDADNPGIWMYHCHVNDHLDAGMMTTFTILP